MGRSATRQGLLCLASILLLVPSAAEPLAGDAADDARPAVDILGVAGAAGTHAFEIRLSLAAAPGAEPEAQATYGIETLFLYRVGFELARGDERYRVALEATMWLRPESDAPGPGAWLILGVQQWQFSGAIDAIGDDHDEAVALPFEAAVDHATIIWTINRTAAGDQLGLLDPSEEWVLSDTYADAAWRTGPATSSIVLILTRDGAPPLASDRAPDAGTSDAAMVLPAAQDDGPAEETPIVAAKEEMTAVADEPVASPDAAATERKDATWWWAGHVGLAALILVAFAWRKGR